MDTFMRMNVKTAELKNHLSHYLRLVREGGETIVICDRNRPIAALSPLTAGELEDPDWKAECDKLRHRFHDVGLTCRPPSKPSTVLPSIEPAIAPDARTDISTVEEMRKSKNW